MGCETSTYNSSPQLLATRLPKIDQLLHPMSPLGTHQQESAHSGCSCMDSLKLIGTTWRRGEDGGYHACAGDLLQLESDIHEVYNKGSQCISCLVDPTFTISLLQQTLPLLMRLRASQEVYSAPPSDPPIRIRRPFATTSPGQSSARVILRDQIRLENCAVDDLEEMECIWSIVLRERVSRLHAMLKGVRRHNLQQQPPGPTQSMRQREEIEALLNRAQGIIWSIAAGFDLRSN